MPDYVRKYLDRLQHPRPKRPQYAPHLWSVPAYVKRLQMEPDPDKSDLLDKIYTKRIQSIVGTMLYYARSVDPMMLRAINEILRVQSQPTRDTAEKLKMLLDHSATYLNVILKYKASDVVLHVDLDAAYLAIPEARSCYAGHFYLSNWPSPSPIKPNPERNVPIHPKCKTIRNVVSSAAEAEKCGTFKNSKTDIGIHLTLIALDHKQPATPLQMDNYTTKGFVNLGMKSKLSKTWDMKWHWLRDK